MKRELQVFPTSRNIRDQLEKQKQFNQFLPTYMLMSEFESQAIVLDNKTLVDRIERILYLQSASDFSEFDKLKFDKNLVKFFTKSEAIFKFFEELSAEEVDFELLKSADAYAEFDKHIEILQKLQNRYKELLYQENLTDRVFVYQDFKLNSAFLRNYDTIKIYIAGYLSRFELRLLSMVAKECELIVVFETSKYNQKLLQRLQELMSFEVELDMKVELNISKQLILKQEQINRYLNTSLYSVEQPIEQVFLAQIEIEKMIEQGIKPENIVLLLPDESTKELFMVYDGNRNLNYAMGQDYTKTKRYKILQALYRRDDYAKELLSLSGIDVSSILQQFVSRCSVVEFFDILDSLDLPKDNQTLAQDIQNLQEEFIQSLRQRVLSFELWLFLWLKKLSKYTIDDTSGGKITAMGVLESRLMEYEGVVVVDFNDTIVPAISSKDQFLNSEVRAFASLPTKSDRESLQKHYYHSILSKAKKSVIIYSTSDNKLPSKFLYEMGLVDAKKVSIATDMIYTNPSQIKTQDEIYVDNFDASAITWSASRLKCFLECKRKYYYRYIAKLESKPTDDINEGSILHTLLQRVFATTKDFKSKDELYKSLSQNLNKIIDTNTPYMQYHKDLWMAKLSNFIDAQIEHFKQGYRVEKVEFEASGHILGMKFKGRIDRLDSNEAYSVAIDYKSGSIKEANRTKNLEVLTDFQMSIYYYLLNHSYPNIQLAFIPLFDSAKLEPISKLEEKNELLLNHIQTLKDTKEFEAIKCEDLQKCRYCDYTLLCGRGEYL
jgi:RecB family exonuclease